MADPKVDERLAKVKDSIKLRELLKVGAKQLKTSDGKYLDFGLALRLTMDRWGVSFSKIEMEEAEHEWSKKFGLLKAGVGDHEIDLKDGFCFTCGVFHSGDRFDVVRIVHTSAFEKRVEEVVVCTNAHLEADGFCTVCGRNHNGGEKVAKPDMMVVRSLGERKGSPYNELRGVRASELRLDTRLWKMSIISQADTNTEAPE